MSISILAMTLALAGALGLLGAGGCVSVDKVEPTQNEKLEQAPGGVMIVTITCEAECEPVAKALEEAGIRVTNKGRMAMGSFDAEITPAQLETVKKTPGVLAVEPDEEAHALDAEP